uniref:Uncharacterized protein n=1 Tax=Arundo donax TaxID=35708 RepID=A0A0A8Y6R7_ARUDO
MLRGTLLLFVIRFVLSPSSIFFG